jgi:hypothetical protein
MSCDTDLYKEINKNYQDQKWVNDNRFHFLDFEFDIKFWQIVPSIALNLHSREIEFVWLCVGLYINF